MNFIEFKPDRQLLPYMDAYWHVTCNGGEHAIDKIIPDGCVDIIINLGEDLYVETVDTLLKSGKAYLGGAITHCMEAETEPDTHLVGVRFKPAAFSYFYSFSSLHETTNRFIELDTKFIPAVQSLTDNIPATFDRYFSDKLAQPKHQLLSVVDFIQQHKGILTVPDVAKAHHVTVRQLERSFKYHIGLSPKEFISIIRYKFAHQLIKSCHPERSLLDIAFECGYYDQAHLSNQIKRYTGVAPTYL